MNKAVVRTETTHLECLSTVLMPMIIHLSLTQADTLGPLLFISHACSLKDEIGVAYHAQRLVFLCSTSSLSQRPALVSFFDTHPHRH